jgi:methionyl-tRNA formyltransferase
MHMDEGLDTGDIILKQNMAIAPYETGGSLHDRLALAAPAALEAALDLLAEGKAPRTPQDNALATHVGKLTREHGHLDWQQSAVQLERTIRAYTPWPGTFTRLPDGSPLKIYAARLVPDGEACPASGTIVSASPLIVSCGQGLLELTEVQAEGRKRMSAGDFMRGHHLPVGSRLQ